MIVDNVEPDTLKYIPCDEGIKCHIYHLGTKCYSHFGWYYHYSFRAFFSVLFDSAFQNSNFRIMEIFIKNSIKLRISYHSYQEHFQWVCKKGHLVGICNQNFIALLGSIYFLGCTTSFYLYKALESFARKQREKIQTTFIPTEFG